LLSSLFTRNTLEVGGGIESVRAAPEAVILASPYAPAAEIVKQAHRDGWPMFLAVSFIGTEAFITVAGKDAEAVVITQIATYDRTDLPTVKPLQNSKGKGMT
jgi:ABC-type branched-subunit amino acid transport system substrate-binding protein